jgi:hypothetical protein
MCSDTAGHADHRRGMRKDVPWRAVAGLAAPLNSFSALATRPMTKAYTLVEQEACLTA